MIFLHPATKKPLAAQTLRRHWTKILSQYVCSTETPDLVLIVQEEQIEDRNCKMQCVWALFDCSITNSLITLRLLKQLGISHQAGHITSMGINSGAMQQSKDIQMKMVITVPYLEYLTPVDESAVLVGPIWAYDSVHRLPWFHNQTPDID